MNGRFRVIWIFLFVLLMGLAADAQEATPDAEIPILPNDLEVITAENAGRLELLMELDDQWDSANDIILTPDGNLLLVASSTGLWLYDLSENLPPVLIGNDGEPVSAIGVNNRNSLMAVGRENTNIELWDVSTLTLNETIHTDTNRVTDLEFSPSDRVLAVAVCDLDKELQICGNGRVILWDLLNNSELGELQVLPGQITNLSFSLDEAILFTQGYVQGYESDRIQRWDIEAFSRIDNLLNSYIVLSADFDDSLAVVEVLNDYYEPYIVVWNLEENMMVGDVEVKEMQIATLAVNPTSSFVVFASEGSIWLWNMETGDIPVLLTQNSSVIEEIVFSPAGEVFATSETEGTIRLWGVRSEGDSQ